jgi:hypothetical protein
MTTSAGTSVQSTSAEFTDAEMLDWLERHHTLHRSVEILYVVDGYEVMLMQDGNEGACFHGTTLRAALDNAMRNTR